MRILGRKMKITIVEMLFCALFISAFLTVRSTAEGYFAITQDQPHADVLRPTGNQRRDIPHTPGTECGELAEWMSQMRERGIKSVDAEGTFAWDGGVESISITNLRYYSSYSNQEPRRQDVLPDLDSFSKMLADAARPVVTRRLRELLPTEVAKARLTRANGVVVVTLFADPCLPVASQLNKLVDPDLSPLIRAASSHNLARFYALLQDGADVNAHDQKGLTPLMAASFAGNSQMAKALLERGARVNDQDIDGRTALHYAAQHKSAADVVPVLLKAGAEMNLRISPAAGRLSGATSLIVAAAMENARAVELLLAAGADPNALTSNGMTALDFARHPIFPGPQEAKVIEILEKAMHEYQ